MNLEPRVSVIGFEGSKAVLNHLTHTPPHCKRPPSLHLNTFSARELTFSHSNLFHLPIDLTNRSCSFLNLCPCDHLPIEMFLLLSSHAFFFWGDRG